MDSASLAATLREIAVYLELEGEKFRAAAYDRAARSIEASKDLERLVAEGRVAELPGVGSSIAGLVGELATTGEAAILDRLRAAWPPMVVELARLPGVGAPKAKTLLAALSPRTLDELADLCDAGAVRALPGFGKVSEAKLAAAIRGRHQRGAQLLLETARELGVALAKHVIASPAAIDVVPCGPARRWIEVVDGLVLAVATTDAAAVRARLDTHPLVAGGLRCTLVVAPPAHFGAAQVIATGPDAHVALLRARADRPLEGIEAPDEAGFYRALGLPLIPPECRDGTDELAVADWSDFVTVADITGAVHCHTVASDGKHTILQMARAAEERGLGFLTITDHSQTASYAGGLTAERLVAQAGEIAAVQKDTKVRLLRGIESDILKDGSLDYPDDVLGGLEVIIASIHNRYKLDEDGMTRRVVAAIRHPLFKIWGHALGRIILNRPPIDVRFDEVLDAIGDAPVAIEINGDPRRLDLEPDRVRRARARGARFVLSTDAHSTRQLDYIENAVGMARRARLRRADVLNTLPPDEFLRAVRPARS